MASRFLVFLLLLCPCALGQETVPPVDAPGDLLDVPGLPGQTGTSATQSRRSLDTLAVLQKDRQDRQAALRSLRDEYAANLNEQERMALFEQLRNLQAQLEEVTYDFETIATGIDVRTFDTSPTDEAFDLPTELGKLVQPLVEELKDATAAPRQIERLRSEMAVLERKTLIANQAMRHVEGLLKAVGPEDPDALRAALEASRASWQAQIADLSRQSSVARFQLDTYLANRTPVLESTRSVLANFFRTRGLNLILAVSTFLLVLLILRGAYRATQRVLRHKSQGERPFYARLINVLYALLSGIAALTGALIVLYATGDWVLLGVTLAFIVGVAWAGKTAAPMFLEQGRLLLNLGTVRERERVLIDGIPYRVSKLSFYTVLSNSELSGGVRRLPIKDLIDLRSRTTSKDEIWFPTKRRDWVLLSDGTRGQVTTQTPDAVQIELLGGGRVTYPTMDFLGLAPQNLSSGFRISGRFGIDYMHQEISTTEVPKVFTQQIRAGLEAQFGADSLKALKVELVEAAASSLDYAILADIDGASAKDFQAISRAIQRLCVETCNSQGWTIPFTQVTLHQA